MNIEEYRALIKRRFWSKRFTEAEVTEDLLRVHLLLRVPINILKTFIEKYLKIENARSYSKETLVRIISDYYFHQTFSLAKRNQENEILNEELEEDEYSDPYEDMFFHFDVEGKKYDLPKHIILLVLSFLEYNSSTVLNISSVNKNFYISVLSTIPMIKIKKNNLHALPLLVLRTTRKIDFQDSLITLSKSECKYLLQNFQLNISFKVIDFSGFDCYSHIKNKFTSLCFENSPRIIFPNCRTIFFPKRSRGKIVNSFRRRRLAPVFATELNSTFPNLNTIENMPPFFEILEVYNENIRSISFSFTSEYFRRGFDVESMKSAFLNLSRLKNFKIHYELTRTDKRKFISSEIARECHNLSTVLPLLPSLESLRFDFDYRMKVDLDFNAFLFKPQDFPNLRELEIIVGRQEGTYKVSINSFFSFEILSNLNVLKLTGISNSKGYNNVEESIKTMSCERSNHRILVLEYFEWRNYDFKRLMVLMKRFGRIDISRVADFRLRRRGRELLIKTPNVPSVVRFLTPFLHETFGEFLTMDGYVGKNIDVIIHEFTNNESSESDLCPWKLMPKKIQEIFGDIEKSQQGGDVQCWVLKKKKMYNYVK